MEVSSLLSLPEGLCVEWIKPQDADLWVGVVSVRLSSCCPLCAQASSQVHSQYQRTLRDVPCGGRKVVLRLAGRTFFCRNPDCTRKIFTERLPPFVEPWAMHKAEYEWKEYCRIMDTFAENYQQWLDYRGRGVSVE